MSASKPNPRLEPHFGIAHNFFAQNASKNTMARRHNPTAHWLRCAFLTALVLLALQPAHASLTLLVGEPYGSFGTMMPAGHTAIYLDRVCAEGPLRLRMCLPGEPSGVAIARYHGIGPTDWIAIPIMQFLYAADRAEDILPYATPAAVWDLRQNFRRRFLSSLFPDGTEHEKQTGEWVETIGVAFDRRLWGYRLPTTPAQDEQAVATINAWPNHHLYRLRKTNCADFSAAILNLYYPGIVKGPNKLADFDWMSPRQVAQSLFLYGRSHPESGLNVTEIPQIPGSLRRSRPVRSAVEAILTTKRYLFTLLVIQPEVPLYATILYLHRERWHPGRNADIQDPSTFEHPSHEVATLK